MSSGLQLPLPTTALATPTSTYVTPTTPPLVTFTPAPTCIPTTAGDQMWLVTGWCFPYPDWDRPYPSSWSLVERPHCTYTRAGNPDENNENCNGNRWNWNAPGPVGGCPVGYTSAGTSSMGHLSKPFDKTLHDQDTTLRYDVTATAVGCCPSVEGLDFKYRTDGRIYSDVHTRLNGVDWKMEVPVPFCYAHPATQLDGHEVTMGVYHDGRVYDKKKKRQDFTSPGYYFTHSWGDQDETTTAVFDAGRDTVWAEDYSYAYTVFHGTHTCYENCREYFSSSYGNTDPNNTPTTAAATTTTAEKVESTTESTTHYPRPSTSSLSTGLTGGETMTSPRTATLDPSGGSPPSATGGNSAGSGGESTNGTFSFSAPSSSAAPQGSSGGSDTHRSGASAVQLGTATLMSLLATGFLGTLLALV